MKFIEFRAIIHKSPWLYRDKTVVDIKLIREGYEEVNYKQIYDEDHLISFFDVLFEAAKSNLKKALLREEEVKSK